MCPHGTDVLDVRENLLNAEKYQRQEITFTNATGVNEGETFALQFTSRLNESFTTYPISFDHFGRDEFRDDVHLALLTLPNKVIDACTVAVLAHETNITIEITFSGDAVQGPQNLIEVLTKKCDKGCTPKLTGLSQLAYLVKSGGVDTALINNRVDEELMADKNSYECGRRGKCDYGSGLCECFEGYTGENCNTQTTLV
jgi:hypothetical protein